VDTIVPEGWDGLLVRAGICDPLREAGWIEAYRRAVPLGQATPVAVTRQGELAAAVPLVATRRTGVKVLTQVGEEGQWFDPEPPCADAEARDQLVSEICRLDADLLVLEGLPHPSPIAEALVRAMPAARIETDAPRFLVDLNNPRSGLRKRRKQCRALLRSAERLGSPLTVDVLEPADIESTIPEVLGFHARTWQGDSPNTLVGTPARYRLNLERITALARSRRARLVTVRDARGEMCAFDLGFVTGSAAVIYAGGYDSSLTDLSGLGWVATLGLIDALQEEGLATADMGVGGGHYKQHLAEESPRCRVLAPLSARGRTALILRALRQRLTKT
jgi:CelD/BcsL family acetyltransferase involved in cellulose biosynthesis